MDPAVQTTPATTRNEAALRVAATRAAAATVNSSSALPEIASPSVHTMRDALDLTEGERPLKRTRRCKPKTVGGGDQLSKTTQATIDRMAAFLDRFENNSPAPRTVLPDPTPVPYSPLTTSLSSQQLQHSQGLQWSSRPSQWQAMPYGTVQAVRQDTQVQSNILSQGSLYSPATEHPMYHPSINFTRGYMYGGPRTDFW